MKYPKEYLEEIKTRLKVSSVVSKTIQLKKEEKNLLGYRHLKTKRHLHLQSTMKKDFIIVLALVSMEIFLIS